MPILEQQGQAAAMKVAVRPSAAIELEWLLHSAVREDFREDHPAVHALYDEDRPDLLAAVSELWAGDGPAVDEPGARDAPAVDAPGATGPRRARPLPAAFTEIVLLARHGGLLFEEDATVLLDALPGLCATVPTGVRDWPLVAETDADRRITLHRLARLRRSAEVRRCFVDVLRQVWDAASASWERDGRAAVADTVAAKQAMLAKGAGWRELVKGSSHFGQTAERVVASLPGDGEIVVVPSYFAHLGLLYDIPGYALLGIRAEEPGSAARERGEELSRRLRALSDATRLAIVGSLRARPFTVTELAQRFCLAQPTVSNHVKLLRDAGIVSEERDGARRNLVVRRDHAAALLDDLARVLGTGTPPRPRDGQ